MLHTIGGMPLLGLRFVTAAVAYVLCQHCVAAVRQSGSCVQPGRCTLPAAKFSRVLEVQPRRQWLSGGGYCGELSIQTGALTKGAWLSQDLIRKAASHGEGHGHPGGGYEVLPTNVKEATQNLDLRVDEWDFRAPKPQAPAFKRWLKSHLAQGHPIVWFPIMKGEKHDPYGHGDNPNDGGFDHVEPMWGIGSNHPLSDSTVYDDDWIVHGSNHDSEPYYRRLNSLDDSLGMSGNCHDAQPQFGARQMYPCFYEQVTYAVAIEGLNVMGSLPVSLKVDGGGEEPNVRWPGTAPAVLHGEVTVSGLVPGKRYVLYRFNDTASVPKRLPFATAAGRATPFQATNSTWTFTDPQVILSDSAAYYLASEEASSTAFLGRP